jgi:hypothetical protein
MSKQNQSKHRPPNGAGLPANEASTWPGSSPHFPTVEKVVT